MYIIIDTSAVNADLKLKNAGIVKLSTKASDQGYKLCFPRVVLEEMAKHYAENTDKAFKDLKRSAKILQVETEANMLNEAEVIIAEGIVKNYMGTLRKRIKELKGTVLKLPSKEQQLEILKKAVKRIKPFNANGTGYQDATIWANIMDIASKFSEHEAITKPKVILVSSNHTDFCNSEAFDLHEDLVVELDDIGLPENAVVVVKTLEDASALLTTHTDVIISDEVIAFFTSPLLEYSVFRTEVEKLILEKLAFRAFTSSKVGLSETFEDPTIDMMHEDFVYENIEVEILTEEYISVTFNVALTCLLDVFVEKSATYHLEDGTISIYDHDWNNHYVAAQLEKTVWFEVILMTTNNFREISGFEIDASEDLNEEMELDQ